MVVMDLHALAARLSLCASGILVTDLTGTDRDQEGTSIGGRCFLGRRGERRLPSRWQAVIDSVSPSIR